MSLRKVFVKIKILFRIRITIRIRILFWNSIPDLHFIHGRHPPNFAWIRWLLQKLLCPHEKSTYVRTSRHPDIQTSRQTYRQTDMFFRFFCHLRHKNHKHLSKGEFFFVFTHAIKILSIVTYSVYDEKVKNDFQNVAGILLILRIKKTVS